MPEMYCIGLFSSSPAVTGLPISREFNKILQIEKELKLSPKNKI
jgi:hypothetical protein